MGGGDTKSSVNDKSFPQPDSLCWQARPEGASQQVVFHPQLTLRSPSYLSCSPSHPPFSLAQGNCSGEAGTDLQVESSNSRWNHNEAFPSRGFSAVTPQTTAGNGIFWKDQNKSRVVNGLSFRQRQCARFQRLEGQNRITMNPLSA